MAFNKNLTLYSNLFNTLSQNGRLNLTEKVIDGFLELMNAHRGEVVVTITSAKPLDKSLTSRLESALKQSQYATTNGAKSVKFDYVVKSSIEGGLMVEFGGRSVDLTVANRVNKLNALLRGTCHNNFLFRLLTHLQNPSKFDVALM